MTNKILWSPKSYQSKSISLKKSPAWSIGLKQDKYTMDSGDKICLSHLDNIWMLQYFCRNTKRGLWSQIEHAEINVM